MGTITFSFSYGQLSSVRLPEQSHIISPEIKWSCDGVLRIFLLLGGDEGSAKGSNKRKADLITIHFGELGALSELNLNCRPIQSLCDRLGKLFNIPMP